MYFLILYHSYSLLPVYMNLCPYIILRIKICLFHGWMAVIVIADDAWSSDAEDDDDDDDDDSYN